MERQKGGEEISEGDGMKGQEKRKEETRVEKKKGGKEEKE